MIKVVVCNGKPGVGKSEFQQACYRLCELNGKKNGFTQDKYLLVDIASTVDFVKGIAYECGWDGTKTLENRKFLSDLKALLTEWNDVPNTIIEDRVKSLSSTYDWIVFVDCREPVEIQKLKERLNATTILIRRESVENSETSNDSDAKVFECDYDLTIYNNSDIIHLEDEARKFIEYMKKEEVPHYVNAD